MDFRRLLFATTVSTALTALLGVYTASSGAGLTCEARWPLCDGAVFGLFPANLPSFIEWSHRLVAMVTGVFILWSAVAAWRGGHQRRIRLATLAALLFTPLQIVFGAFTVLVHEFVFGYSIVVLTLHFALAALILGLFVAATVWAYAAEGGVTIDGVERAGVYALLGVPLLAALTPRLFVTFGEAVQLLYYGLGFAVFAALVVVALWGRELSARRLSVAGGAAAALVIAQLVLTRRAFGTEGQLVVLGLSFGTFVLAAAAVWYARNMDRGRLRYPGTAR